MWRSSNPSLEFSRNDYSLDTWSWSGGITRAEKGHFTSSLDLKKKLSYFSFNISVIKIFSSKEKLWGLFGYKFVLFWSAIDLTVSFENVNANDKKLYSPAKMTPSVRKDATRVLIILPSVLLRSIAYDFSLLNVNFLVQLTK